MHHVSKSKRLHVYKRHLARLESWLIRLEQENQRFLWLRLGTFFVGVIITYLGFQVGGGVGWAVGMLALIGFGVLVGFHRRLDRARRDFEITRMITQQQIARMTLDWRGIPVSSPHPDDSHPLARDLTLTGDRSLLQLLNTAFSRGGADRLRAWLLEPVNATRINARQTLLREIIPLTGFRTRLARVSARVHSSDQPWDGERVLQWLETHRAGRSLRAILFFLFPLAWINITLFVLSVTGTLPPLWLISVTVYFGVYFWLQGTFRDTFNDAAYLTDALTAFRAVSQFLEQNRYPPGLAEVCASFIKPTNEWRSLNRDNAIKNERLRKSVRDERPSRVLQRVIWVASAASLQGNPLLALLLNLVMPWDLFFAHQMEQMKARLRMLLPKWLEAWYELEALNSMANFAYLNPSATFPIIAPDAILEVEGLGHPLIPDEARVTNDFSLNQLGELAIITGSNMSGKSTFLRTLGVNLVMAYAGGPVLAQRLLVRPMRLCTSIQVSDSLADGLSYFYSEVKRLKALLDELQKNADEPLFFLIDELFRGTNNEERRKGSEAYIHALAGANGIGLVSTHDLELTRLAETISGVINYHFREEITDGRMVFDYLLHPGPCPTTNALKIMALEGLPVYT